MLVLRSPLAQVFLCIVALTTFSLEQYPHALGRTTMLIEDLPEDMTDYYMMGGDATQFNVTEVLLDAIMESAGGGAARKGGAGKAGGKSAGAPE